jgi:hypothetical protein
MHYWKILKKVKLFVCTPGRNMKQRRYSFIPSSHHVVSGQLNVLAALLSGKVPPYPLNKRLGG